MKKILCLTICMFLLVGTISFVSAGEIPTTVGDNFIARIISSIRFALHEQEMFTIYGREMMCSIYPDTKVYLKNTLFGDKKFYFSEDTVCGSQSFFVNYYRGAPGSDQYLKEIYYKDGTAYVTDGDGQGSLYTSAYVQCDAGAYWDNNCYVEVYCCAQGACNSDNECSSSEECADGHISSLFSQLGVCKSVVVQTHTTKVYQCLSDGSSEFLTEVDTNSINWCSDPNKNNYLLLSGGTSGVCYTPENEPCYVPAPAPGEDDGNGEVTGSQKGISASSIEMMSDTSLINSLCVWDEECSEGDCLTMRYLIDRNYLTEEKAKSSLTNFCNIGWGMNLLTSLASKLGLAADVCGWFRNDLDSYLDGYGYCIVEIEEKSFLEDLAFFNITGDKNVDGAIILGAGLLIIVLILSRLGFVEEFEYVE